MSDVFHETRLVRFEALLGKIFISILVTFTIAVVIDNVSFYVHPSRKQLVFQHSPLCKRFPGGLARYPQPYVGFTGKPKTALFNELGYRGDLPVLPKPADEYRIFIVGGSAVFLGEPSIPEAIEQELHKAGQQNARTYNFGVISSVSGMELARILHQLVDFKPDLIISYSGGNDLTHPLFWDPRPGYPFNFVAFEKNPLLEADAHSYPLMPLILYSSNLLRRYFPDFFVKQFVNIDELRSEVRFGSPDWERAIAQKYVLNLKKSQVVANSFGIRWMSVFQPMLAFKQNLSPSEGEHLQLPVQTHVKKLHSLVREEMKLEAPELQETFHDFSNVFGADSSEAFIDDIHTTNWGTEFVAKALARSILEFPRM